MAGQNFSSLSGILKTDREEYYAKLNCDTYEYLSWRLGIVQSRNNLKDGLVRSARYCSQQFGISLRPISESQENIFKNVNSGVSLYSGTALTTNLNYLISDTNDNILSQNVKRQMLVLETLYFLDRDRTRDLVLSYTLDTLENKNAGRDYSENLVKLEFRQRF